MAHTDYPPRRIEVSYATGPEIQLIPVGLDAQGNRYPIATPIVSLPAAEVEALIEELQAALEAQEMQQAQPLF